MKTPQDQVKGGREEGIYQAQLCVNRGEHYTCQTIHNSPSNAEMDLCGDSVNK